VGLLGGDEQDIKASARDLERLGNTLSGVLAVATAPAAMLAPPLGIGLGMAAGAATLWATAWARVANDPPRTDWDQWPPPPTAAIERTRRSGAFYFAEPAADSAPWPAGAEALDSTLQSLAEHFIASSYWITTALISAERVEGARVADADRPIAGSDVLGALNLQRSMLRYTHSLAVQATLLLEPEVGGAPVGLFRLYGWLLRAVGDPTADQLEDERRSFLDAGGLALLAPLTRGLTSVLPRRREVMSTNVVSQPWSTAETRDGWAVMRRALAWGST
jgi:hypothetical protein